MKNTHLSSQLENLEKILLVMMPIIPHISSECLDKLNYNENFRWPEVNLKYLQNEMIKSFPYQNSRKTSKWNAGIFQKNLVIVVVWYISLIIFC